MLRPDASRLPAAYLDEQGRAIGRPPRVWVRQALRTGPLCDCTECKAAEVRLDARALAFAPGSMPAAMGRR